MTEQQLERYEELTDKAELTEEEATEAEELYHLLYPDVENGE